jgi:hypothetical protein
VVVVIGEVVGTWLMVVGDGGTRLMGVNYALWVR